MHSMLSVRHIPRRTWDVLQTQNNNKTYFSACRPHVCVLKQKGKTKIHFMRPMNRSYGHISATCSLRTHCSCVCQYYRRKFNVNVLCLLVHFAIEFNWSNTHAACVCSPIKSTKKGKKSKKRKNFPNDPIGPKTITITTTEQQQNNIRWNWNWKHKQTYDANAFPFAFVSWQYASRWTVPLGKSICVAFHTLIPNANHRTEDSEWSTILCEANQNKLFKRKWIFSVVLFERHLTYIHRHTRVNKKKQKITDRKRLK